MPEQNFALNADSVRAAMLERVEVPKELVTKLLRKFDEKLDAKKTKFFTFRGEVIDTREVEDTTAQLNAADRLASIAGLYVRERDVRDDAGGFALEVDTKTGVIRLVMASKGGGRSSSIVTTPVAEPQEPVVSDPIPVQALQPAKPPEERGAVPVEPVQVVKLPRGKIPPSVYSILYGPDE